MVVTYYGLLDPEEEEDIEGSAAVLVWGDAGISYAVLHI